MLAAVPDRPAPEEAVQLLRLVEALRPRPVPWLALTEWALLPALLALLVCQVTGRVDRALWFLAGSALALLLVRPLVRHRLRGSG